MNGQRLELARKRAGYSLRGLSEALGGEPSHQAIRKYERGEMSPSSGVLVAMARTLGVSVDFLMSDEVRSLEGVEFRKLSISSAKDRARVEAEVMDQVDRYLIVEEILGLNSAHWDPPVAMERLASEDAAEELADRVRNSWDLGHDPIPNLTELLEEHGLKVFVVPLPAAVSGLTCWVARDRGERLPVIVVNRGHGLERRRFTLAHELGHRLIDLDSAVKVERAANRFAGAFLVPGRHLRDRVSVLGSVRRLVSPAEIMRLKRLYRVSAAAMLMRLGQIEVLSESAVRYAFQTFARGWRKEEPNPLESEGIPLRELPKRFEQLCYWALAERLIVPSRAAELLGVSMKRIEEALKGPGDAHADHR
ncbi:XRE family transcriptional regulator [Thalassobaculum sp.]|uniref:XRE family transcriptional regulator n=1 Tax=Thalassobaculum sp. TaxID=2022740 RepID=UPI0032EF24A7